MCCFRSIPAAAGAVISLLLVGGCAGGNGPVPSNTPGEAVAATPSPIALSEDEALAIAVATYEEFLEAERTLYESSGSDAVPMESVITENMHDYYDWILKEVKSDDFTVVGNVTVVTAQVQSYKADTLTFYTCVDWTGSQVYDGDGQPLGPERNGVVQAAEISVTGIGSDPRVDRHELWENLELCQ